MISAQKGWKTNDEGATITFPASSLPRCSTCGRGCPTPGCLPGWCASGFRSSGGRTDRSLLPGISNSSRILRTCRRIVLRSSTKSTPIDFRQRIGDHVGHFVDFVAADSHNTALYLRVSSLFTLRNIS